MSKHSPSVYSFGITVLIRFPFSRTSRTAPKRQFVAEGIRKVHKIFTLVHEGRIVISPHYSVPVRHFILGVPYVSLKSHSVDVGNIKVHNEQEQYDFVQNESPNKNNAKETAILDDIFIKLRSNKMQPVKPMLQDLPN